MLTHGLQSTLPTGTTSWNGVRMTPAMSAREVILRSTPQTVSWGWIAADLPPVRA